MTNADMLVYTRHARQALQKRGIREEWVERAVDQPQLTEHDALDPALIHCLLAISENGGRVIRVVANQTVTPRLVITAYFDRAMKGKL